MIIITDMMKSPKAPNATNKLERILDTPILFPGLDSNLFM